MPQSMSTGCQLPEPGDILGGKYAIERRLGEGGMAVVYEATHLRLRHRLAIKVLKPEVQGVDLVHARFEREARATASLRSIHTARVIDVDTLPGGLPYMVLEYLEGRDLDVELQASGRLSVDEAVDIVLQVADAMAEAHEQGIVHRDLKPANLFVCHADQRRVMKILDFGISRDQNESARITAADAYFGTPSYASPEQLRDASQADMRSDVWSLGVVLFEALTGRTPFEGSATQVIAKVMADPIPWPCDLRADIPRGLARVVLRALQRDPAQRFQTMRELSAALAPFGPEKSAAAELSRRQRGRGRLGDILVSEGLLSNADLERALARQQRTGELLGTVLLAMELVSRADLLAAVAKQQGIDAAPSKGADVPSAADEDSRRTAPTFPGARPDSDSVGKSSPRATGTRVRRRPTRAIAIALCAGVLVSAAVALAGGLVSHRAPAAGPVASTPASR